MASRLERLLAEVQTLVEVPDIQWGFGVLDLAKQQSPPRIVWINPSDDYVAPDPNVTNPRSVITRRASVYVHCWGADREMTEALAEQVIVALIERCGAALRITPGTWVTQQPQQAGNNVKGEVYELPVTIDMPVFKKPWALARVSDVRFVSDGAVQGDGVLTSGEQ